MSFVTRNKGVIGSFIVGAISSVGVLWTVTHPSASTDAADEADIKQDEPINEDAVQEYMDYMDT
jgi:hypothetical protein